MKIDFLLIKIKKCIFVFSSNVCKYKRWLFYGVDIVLVVFIYVEKTVCCLCCGGDGWTAASWANCSSDWCVATDASFDGCRCVVKMYLLITTWNGLERTVTIKDQIW